VYSLLTAHIIVHNFRFCPEEVADLMSSFILPQKPPPFLESSIDKNLTALSDDFLRCRLSGTSFLVDLLFSAFSITWSVTVQRPQTRSNLQF
jgi:hypothetical protein